MTAIGKGADLMEILKKKMRQSKEDLESVRDENEELSHKLQVELQRRETVSEGDYTLSAFLKHQLIEQYSRTYSVKYNLTNYTLLLSSSLV